MEQLVETGFFDDLALFRVNDWIVQFGARQHDASYNKAWSEKLEDDPNPFNGTPWHRGVVAFWFVFEMRDVEHSNSMIPIHHNVVRDPNNLKWRQGRQRFASADCAQAKLLEGHGHGCR